jgi:hypothetical protein
MNMKKIRNKFKKKYSTLRKSYSSVREYPKRLIINKAQWMNNADSPVMLMIDDLSNAWHSTNGRETWDFGGDWGGGLSHKESTISFIRANLLHDYPEIKITFFAIAGSTSQYTHDEPFSFSQPLDYSDESKTFFKKLADDENIEIAYHGYNHGTPGKTTEDFIQEWKGFKSIDEACEQIARGKEIFNNILGQYPSGGKYGGWEYNKFADTSIDLSGFLWWCRDWMPRDVTDHIDDRYYEPQFFGDCMVVALPSTVHGFFWDVKQIDKLIDKKQIISIEEHIAPLRPDGRTQTPNIIDDVNELRKLFAYLRKKNVWYATGTEVAEYFTAFSFTTIYDIKPDSFKVNYMGRVEDPTLTLLIDFSYAGDRKNISIITPDNEIVECTYKDQLHVANIKIKNGRYVVRMK